MDAKDSVVTMKAKHSTSKSSSKGQSLAKPKKHKTKTIARPVVVLYPIYRDHAHDPCSVRDRQAAAHGGISVTFPEKLHRMLTVASMDSTSDGNVLSSGQSLAIGNFDHIISWQPHGRCFLIHDKHCFVSKVMPMFFDQTKLASFQRQLNLYGFFRLTNGRDRGGYYHEFFLRGRPDLCHHLARTTVKGIHAAVPFSAAEPDFYSMDYCLANNGRTSPPPTSESSTMDCNGPKLEISNMDNTGAEQPVAMVSWKSSYGDEIDGRVTCTRQHQETTSDAANGRATLKGQFDKGEHQYVSYVHFPSILVTPESSPEQSRLPHMIKNTDILRQLEFPIGLVATFENRFSESSNNNNNSHFDFDFPPLTNSSYDAEKNATIEPLSLGLALSHPRDDCCSVDFDWALQPIDECVFMDEEDEVSLDSVKFSFLDHYDTSDHA